MPPPKSVQEDRERAIRNLTARPAAHLANQRGRNRSDQLNGTAVPSGMTMSGFPLVPRQQIPVGKKCKTKLIKSTSIASSPQFVILLKKQNQFGSFRGLVMPWELPTFSIG